MSNAVEKNAIPSLVGLGLQLLVFRLAELERFAMLAVGGAEAVLVVVRLVEHLARVEPAVVALLQLRGGDAAFGRRLEQLVRRLQAALVVVADFRDDVCVAVVADDSVRR